MCFKISYSSFAIQARQSLALSRGGYAMVLLLGILLPRQALAHNGSALQSLRGKQIHLSKDKPRGAVKMLSANTNGRCKVQLHNGSAQHSQQVRPLAQLKDKPRGKVMTLHYKNKTLLQPPMHLGKRSLPTSSNRVALLQLSGDGPRSKLQAVGLGCYSKRSAHGLQSNLQPARQRNLRARWAGGWQLHRYQCSVAQQRWKPLGAGLLPRSQSLSKSPPSPARRDHGWPLVQQSKSQRALVVLPRNGSRRLLHYRAQRLWRAQPRVGWRDSLQSVSATTLQKRKPLGAPRKLQQQGRDHLARRLYKTAVKRINKLQDATTFWMMVLSYIIGNKVASLLQRLTQHYPFQQIHTNLLALWILTLVGLGAAVAVVLSVLLMTLLMVWMYWRADNK